uniref:Uncharacterized protein n=1 Tax=Prevotella sp. GTC17253 TaxID=3236793 RepID=A0AB33ITT7_9BACT
MSKNTCRDEWHSPYDYDLSLKWREKSQHLHLSKENIIFAPSKEYNKGGKTMNTNTIFNPTQLHLLKLFSFNETEEELAELKTALMDFYQKKLDKRLNELWDKGEITDEKLEEIKTMHLRKHADK